MGHLKIWNGNRIKKVYMQFSESHETGQEHVRPIITKKNGRKKNEGKIKTYLALNKIKLICTFVI